MTRADLNTGFGVRCSLRTHALLDLTGHGQEGLFDIGSILSRRLKERDAKAVGEFLFTTVR